MPMGEQVKKKKKALLKASHYHGKGSVIAFIEYLLWARHHVKCFPELSNKTLITSLWHGVVGWIVSPKKICSSSNPLIPVNMLLCRPRGLADVIELRWGHSGSGWPWSNDWRGRLDIETVRIHPWKKVLWGHSQKLGWCSYKTRSAKD